jgi:SAM-dependent methyltransferase
MMGRVDVSSSTYLFGRQVDDRRRLQHQFELLCEDFLAWFERALRHAGLATDPQLADWSVVDVGCGAGQYVGEIARRYPRASIVGTDLNPAAIAEASAAELPNVRFAVHDARTPVPAELVPADGFDVAVGWMVLLHLPDKAGALAHLADAVRPGGALLLGNIPDRAVLLDHPAAVQMLSVGQEALERIGMVGLEDSLESLLAGAGFTDVRTAVLRYLAGGATVQGQRWYQLCLAAFVVGRPLLVDVTRLMDGAEYDRLLDAVLATPSLDASGEMRYLATIARRR